MFGVDVIPSWRKRLTVYVLSKSLRHKESIRIHAEAKDGSETIEVWNARLRGDLPMSQVAEGAKGWSGLRTERAVSFRSQHNLVQCSVR